MTGCNSARNHLDKDRESSLTGENGLRNMEPAIWDCLQGSEVENFNEQQYKMT